MKNYLRYGILVASCACFGTSLTNAGDSDTYPLIRVDGVAIPHTISDATGKSVQITGGSLTTTSYSPSCDYKISFSNGTVFTGYLSCGFSPDLRQIVNGVQLSLDASDGGGPQGAHTYDFNTNTGKPCTCGRLCANPNCNIQIDSARSARSTQNEARPPNLIGILRSDSSRTDPTISHA